MAVCLAGWISGQQLSMRHVSVKEGLAQSQVRAVTQDELGYLWVGTSGGVSRYDGRRFLTITKEDGLTDDFVWSLAPTADGGVWVGTDRGGVARWDRNRLSHPLAERGLPVSRIRTLAVDRGGNLWIGYREGLFRSDGSGCALFAPLAVDGLFTAPRSGEVAVLSAGGLWRVRGDRVEEITVRPIGQTGHVAAAVFGDDDTLWAIDEDGRLWRRHPDGAVEAVPFTGRLPRARVLRVTRLGGCSALKRARWCIRPCVPGRPMTCACSSRTGRATCGWARTGTVFFRLSAAHSGCSRRNPACRRRWC